VIIDAEPGRPVDMRTITLREGRSLLRSEFDSAEEAVAWLQANPESYVELTMRTTTYLDGKLRKILADAHERIVDVVPKIIRSETEEDGVDPLYAAGTETDMNSLFLQYFRSKYGTDPSESILSLFREVSG
jgi:exonuclease SbcD